MKKRKQRGVKGLSWEIKSKQTKIKAGPETKQSDLEYELNSVSSWPRIKLPPIIFLRALPHVHVALNGQAGVQHFAWLQNKMRKVSADLLNHVDRPLLKNDEKSAKSIISKRKNRTWSPFWMWN